LFRWFLETSNLCKTRRQKNVPALVGQVVEVPTAKILGSRDKIESPATLAHNRLRNQASDSQPVDQETQAFGIKGLAISPDHS
jgi:hypothetical protein